MLNRKRFVWADIGVEVTTSCDNLDMNFHVVPHNVSNPIITMRGKITFSGCLDLTFENDGLHLCGMEKAAEFASVVVRLFDLACILIPDWKSERELVSLPNPNDMFPNTTRAIAEVIATNGPLAQIRFITPSDSGPILALAPRAHLMAASQEECDVWADRVWKAEKLPALN